MHMRKTSLAALQIRVYALYGKSTRILQLCIGTVASVFLYILIASAIILKDATGKLIHNVCKIQHTQSASGLFSHHVIFGQYKHAPHV